MKVRLVKKCGCEVKEPKVQIVRMRYGFQVEVSNKCPVCGKQFREMPGKGAMVTDIVEVKSEKPFVPHEQITSNKPTIGEAEEVGEPMSFGKRMAQLKKAKREKLDKTRS